MSSIHSYHCLTTSPHGADEVADSLLGNFIPFLLKGPSELRQGARLVCTATNGPPDHVPHVFDGIKVRRLGWPLQSVDPVVVQVPVHNMCSVRSSIVIHENEIRTNSSCVRPDNWVKDLNPVPDRRQSTVPDHMEVCLSMDADSAPNHEGATSVTVVLGHVAVVESLIPGPPHPPSAICHVHAESGLICKQHRRPVTDGPRDMLSGPCSPALTMLPGQGDSDCRSSGPQTNFVKSPSHRFCRDSSSTGAVELILKLSSIQEWFSTGLNHEESVFPAGGFPRLPTSMPPGDRPRGLVPVPQP